VTSDDGSPIFCARCAKELHAGRGEFYVVNIDAKADPTPPILDDVDMDRDFESEINAVVAELHKLSAREAMDQVHRRLAIHLCITCFREWIENPAG
jgi:hypothetical protein